MANNSKTGKDPTADNPPSGLVFQLTELYENYRTNRLPLQEKWTRNHDAFKAITTRFWKTGEAEKWRSNTFVNITKQKVMATFAIIVDVALRIGEIPFGIEPSAQEETFLTEEATDDQQEEIRTDVDNMRQKIRSQLINTRADKQYMKNTLSSGIYGETYNKVLRHVNKKKGFRRKPIPGIEDISSLPMSMVEMERFTEEEVQPSWVYRSVWDIFRDLEEDDMFESRGTFDRTFVSAYQLRRKIGQPFFIEKAIKEVIKESSKQGSTGTGVIPADDTASLAPQFRNIQFRTKTIRYLEFWGRMGRQDVEDFERTMKQGKTQSTKDAADTKTVINPNEGESQDVVDEPDSITADNDSRHDGDEVEIFAVVADQRIVAFARTSNEMRPFHRAVAEDNLDDVGGTGVADNVESSQDMVNGHVRAFNDNKKLSGNVITAMREDMIDKIPNTLMPGSVIKLNAAANHINEAMQVFEMPDVGSTLMEAIALGRQIADDDSMIPKVTQGIKETSDETLGQSENRNAQAGKYIGTMLGNMDEGIVEPTVRDFLEFNIDDPDNPLGKGDYVVKALGFATYQAETITISSLTGFKQFIEADPEEKARWKTDLMTEDIAKASQIETKKYLKTDEELAAEAQAQQEAIANDPAIQLEFATKQAEAEKTQAEAQKLIAEAQTKAQEVAGKLAIEEEKVKLQRAELALEARKQKKEERDNSAKALRERNQP